MKPEDVSSALMGRCEGSGEGMGEEEETSL